MMMFRFPGGAVLALAALAARADDHGPRVAPPAAYLHECGACHVPFPARGLSAASWQRLMADLPRHFGTGRRAEVPPQDRITRSAWFVREHDEVPASVWRSAAVGKPSNCVACHTRAADGRFGEREFRLPL
jgi:mono/diheme cytochrome c family protein